MMGFMIYFAKKAFFFKIFKVFKVFLKSGPRVVRAWKNGEKWGEMGWNV